MRLIDIYTAPLAALTLYKLLEERPRENWISHEIMPSWEDHCEFVESRPFYLWLLIEEEGTDFGAIEVTDRNEIGIALFRRYRRRGYGRQALGLFLDSYTPLPAIPALRNGRWLANVAPDKLASIEFFKRCGFRTIQHTLALPNG